MSPYESLRPEISKETYHPYSGSFAYGPDVVDVFAAFGLLKQPFDKSYVLPIPGFEGQNHSIPASKTKIVATVSDTPSINWSSKEELAHIACDANTLREGRALAYLGQNITEYSRQLRHEATVHGNAIVTPEGKGVLLLGDKGAGKTLMTLFLALKRDCSFYANGQVVFGGKDEDINLINGVKEIYVRKQFGGTSEGFTSAENATTGNSVITAFDDKNVSTADSLQIPQINGKVPLTTTIILHMDAFGKDKLTVRRKDKQNIASNLFLAEKLQRQISGVSTPLISASGDLLAFSPNFSTPQTKENILELVNNLYMKGIFEVSGGDYNEIADAILALT